MNAREITQKVFDFYKPYLHESYWERFMRSLRNCEETIKKFATMYGEPSSDRVDAKYLPVVEMLFDLYKPYMKGSPHWEKFVMYRAQEAATIGNISRIEVRYCQDRDEIDKIKFRSDDGYTFCILEPWRRLPRFEGDNWQEAYPEEYERILGLLDSVKEHVSYYNGDTPMSAARRAVAMA